MDRVGVQVQTWQRTLTWIFLGRLCRMAVAAELHSLSASRVWPKQQFSVGWWTPSGEVTEGSGAV